MRVSSALTIRELLCHPWMSRNACKHGELLVEKLVSTLGTVDASTQAEGLVDAQISCRATRNLHHSRCTAGAAVWARLLVCTSWRLRPFLCPCALALLVGQRRAL